MVKEIRDMIQIIPLKTGILLDTIPAPVDRFLFFI